MQKASETINAMETFEFTNVGVKRGYEEHTSMNTQFEAMELEEDQERNTICISNNLHKMKSIILTLFVQL